MGKDINRRMLKINDVYKSRRKTGESKAKFLWIDMFGKGMNTKKNIEK